jgi:hypothetical protein
VDGPSGALFATDRCIPSALGMHQLGGVDGDYLSRINAKASIKDRTTERPKASSARPNSHAPQYLTGCVAARLNCRQLA